MKRISFIFLLSSFAFGQGVILPPQQALKVVNGITSPVANATITVCAANTSGIPCSPVLASALFKDAALTQPLSNPFTSDANGNYVFAIAPGNYTVTVTAAGFSGYSYQTTAPVAASASNIFSNTNTFNGTTNLSGGGSLTGTFGGGPTTFTGNNNFTGVNTASTWNAAFYVGTGITTWSGSDIGAQINTAYAALPPIGGIIYVLPPTGGGNTYNFSTPIVFNVSGKCASLVGVAGQAGPIELNYTPVTATTALTIDCPGPTGNGLRPFMAMRDISLMNNNCLSFSCVSGSATGIVLGPTNSGANRGQFQNVNISGFQTGVSVTSSSSWGLHWLNCSFTGNGTAFTNNSNSIESTMFFACNFTNNGTSLAIASGDIYVIGGSMDQPQTVGISQTGGIISATDVHWENSGSGGSNHMWNATGSAGSSATIHGGILQDDQSSGAVDYFYQFATTAFSVEGLYVASSGRSSCNIISALSPARGYIRLHRHTSGCVDVSGANTANVTDLTQPDSSANSPQPIYFEAPFKGGSTSVSGVAGSSSGEIDFGINVPLTTLTRIASIGCAGCLVTGSTQGDTAIRNDTSTNKIWLANGGTPIMGISNTGIVSELGLQIFNTTTTCTTTTTQFNTCTTAAISLPVTETDTSYRVSCTGKGATNFPTIVQTTNSSTSQFTITIITLTAAAATYSSFDCIAGHN